MSNLLTNFYPVLVSIVTYLDDDDLETLTHVNKEIYKIIMDRQICWNRIKYHGLNRSMIHILGQQRVFGFFAGQYVWTITRTNLHDLFEKSITTDIGLKVYVPIYFIIEVQNVGVEALASIKPTKEMDILEKELDVKSFISVRQVKGHYKFYTRCFIHDIRIITGLDYEDTMTPLINYSDRCIFQYNNIFRVDGHKTIGKNVTPVLEFVFKYVDYINMLNHMSNK